MLNYHELSKELQKEIIRDRQVGWKNPYACTDEQVIRKNRERDKASLWRPLLSGMWKRSSTLHTTTGIQIRPRYFHFS